MCHALIKMINLVLCVFTINLEKMENVLIAAQFNNNMIQIIIVLYVLIRIVHCVPHLININAQFVIQDYF